ncbi:hypothetical protein SARC_05682 [Sphaeroforma arctica JP610]|uniref:Uncharacterized protein n=1 Tax=Sphaeroforma arctica JP610 TaxID=667725 RepID=A0A0L0FYV0_9EUKA|nr:hypothetical protein SARC_05682 [Sphaeroforma arctica JP610]KNC82022.1 hypothetical protein SARC_05682 [Sphaeroforma arctica JP610]|eukprot:XP_014155924.1 hypothetical protein SARC_05682 [Sphaeroforma arctica JP610]
MQVVNNNITWSHSALRPLEVTIQVSIFINDGLFDVTRARPMMLSSDWDVDLAACQAYNLVHNTSYLVGQSTAARGGVGVENPNGNGFNLYYEHGMRVTDLLTVPQNSCLVVADGPFVPFRMLVCRVLGLVRWWCW